MYFTFAVCSQQFQCSWLTESPKLRWSPRIVTLKGVLVPTEQDFGFSLAASWDLVPSSVPLTSFSANMSHPPKNQLSNPTTRILE